MNARPWYRWHWVTYVVLLVTGGAVVYLQAFQPYRSEYGWPFVFVYIYTYLGPFGPVPSREIVTWYPGRVLGDFAICMILFASVTYCAGYVLRNRFRISIGSVLMFVFAMALAFSWAGFESDLTSQGRYYGMHFSASLPDVVSTAWAPLPIRIIIWTAIACTFNVIGWGIVLFSIRCARIVSRRLSADA